MVLAAIWVARAWGKAGLPAMLGAFLFLVSDAPLGYALLRERPFAVGQIIWARYIYSRPALNRAGRAAFSRRAGLNAGIRRAPS